MKSFKKIVLDEEKDEVVERPEKLCNCPCCRRCRTRFHKRGWGRGWGRGRGCGRGRGWGGRWRHLWGHRADEMISIHVPSVILTLVLAWVLFK